MKRTLASLLNVMVVVLLAAAPAGANTIVFENAPGAGSQQDFVLGMDFNVLSPVWVTQLGAFDNNGDGFANPIQVGIFNLTGGLVGSSAVLTGTGGTLVGGSRFVFVTPFLLSPGTYSIVAAGFTGGPSGDYSGNTGIGGSTTFNTAGGSLSLVPLGGRWNTGNTFQLPTQNLGGYGQPDPVFQAGTFSVPDGGTTAMLFGAVLVVFWAIRRRLVA